MDGFSIFGRDHDRFFPGILDRRQDRFHFRIAAIISKKEIIFKGLSWGDRELGAHREVYFRKSAHCVMRRTKSEPVHETVALVILGCDLGANVVDEDHPVQGGHGPGDGKRRAVLTVTDLRNIRDIIA